MPAESSKNWFKRTMYIKNKIRELINSGEVPEDHKIILISHWSFLKHYTSDEDSIYMNEDGDIKIKGSIDGFKNCEIAYDYKNFPK